MPANFPYMHSSGMIEKLIAQLRSSFPDPFTADTLRTLGLMPKNESYAINLLRFLGLIDGEGQKDSDAAKAFLLHDDNEFGEAFQKLIQGSYKSLFDLHGKHAWTLDRGKLVTFFRQSDSTSDLVGGRQGLTFESLARICGQREITEPGPKSIPRKAAPKKTSARKSQAVGAAQGHAGFMTEANLGLTVRIEVNLPAQADKETYDAIFRSIRENLIGAK